eukprot:1138531-Pelagomonas_calceolata.AAC.2
MGLTIEPPHDHGLTTQEVEQLQKEWGLNHVAAKTIPEWKKILDRYLDWVSLIIVSVTKQQQVVGCATVAEVGAHRPRSG